MGLADWRAKRQMKDPVRGVFKVTGWYDAHPSSSPPGTRITGVITAPGIPATAAEHKADERGRWAAEQELPVLVDRADPQRFAILWAEVKPASWRDRELTQAQQAAAELNAAQQAAGPPDAGRPAAEIPQAGDWTAGTPQAGAWTAGTPQAEGWTAGAPGTGAPDTGDWLAGLAAGGEQPGRGQSQVFVTMSQDGQPMSMTPEMAAQVQQAMRQAMDAVSDMTGQASGALAGWPAGPAQSPGAPSGPAEGSPGGVPPQPPHGGFTADQAARLVATGRGERANAIVLAVNDVPAQPGVPQAPAGTADLTLEITRADGSMYTAVTRVGFSTPGRRASVAVPGKRLSVLIDPAAPARVAIDTSMLTDP
jgi:hypothetical protein